MQRKPFELDWESVDNITKANLLECYQMTHKELLDYAQGKHMHDEDVAVRRELLPALKTVLAWFGERVEDAT